MVHQYQLNGYNIVLDTCSGSVHVVDDVAYDVIALYADHTPDEIVSAMMEKYGDRPDVTEEDLRQCIEDVTALKEAGKLWSPDVYEDMAFDFKNRNTVVKALCLHVAHTCNLNCSYCFASQGRYEGERALMSFEVGKRAMDFLIENSGTRRNLEVDFFGGEPLMNFDMVKKLVAYCREQEKIHNKNFRFTMTTNGMLIDDDVIDFCNKECHNVVLSLDGRKESTTASARITRATAAMMPSCPSSRSSSRSAVIRTTTCAALTPTLTRILPTTSSTWPTSALPS